MSWTEALFLVIGMIVGALIVSIVIVFMLRRMFKDI